MTDDGRPPLSTHLPIHPFTKVHDDHATDIIESMWGGLGKPFFAELLEAERDVLPACWYR